MPAKGVQVLEILLCRAKGERWRANFLDAMSCERAVWWRAGRCWPRWDRPVRRSPRRRPPTPRAARRTPGARSHTYCAGSAAVLPPPAVPGHRSRGRGRRDHRLHGSVPQRDRGVQRRRRRARGGARRNLPDRCDPPAAATSNLHVPQGATICSAPTRPVPAGGLTRWQGIECYNYSPFIYAYGQTNVAITGRGTIDGQRGTGRGWLGRGAGPDWDAAAADGRRRRAGRPSGSSATATTSSRT